MLAPRKQVPFYISLISSPLSDGGNYKIITKFVKYVVFWIQFWVMKSCTRGQKHEMPVEKVMEDVVDIKTTFSLTPMNHISFYDSHSFVWWTVYM